MFYCLAKNVKKRQKYTFGALLVDADGNILMEQGNVEITEHRCTGHAETGILSTIKLM